MSEQNTSYQFNPIGYARTPFTEKFPIPRQPGLITADNSQILLEGHANREESIRGLSEFSHIWVLFVFHEAIKEDWKPMVRPPRLGGNEKVGVFASRSPYRPNPIGQSVIKLLGISKSTVKSKEQWILDIEGSDLLDKTPILDIKPYLPYADSIESAVGGFAKEKPPSDSLVEFSDQATAKLVAHQDSLPNLRVLITQVLQQQPQPAYHGDNRTYGFKLYNLNIRWELRKKVTDLLPVSNNKTDVNPISKIHVLTIE